jgi:hypothetical protein
MAQWATEGIERAIRGVRASASLKRHLDRRWHRRAGADLARGAGATAAFPDSGAAYNRRMAARRLNEPIEPMTLGNMRANGVRSLHVSCWLCHHRTILSAEPWPECVPVPTFPPRMVCTVCGIIGADARPNWRERTTR